MAIKLDNLGFARVYRHPRTGELVVDTDSLRRGGGPATAGRPNHADFGAEEDDDEDFEGDDEIEGDEDDFEGDDEVEGDEDVDLGAANRRPRPRQQRRQTRRATRQTRRATRRAPAPAPAPRRVATPGPVMDGTWGMTAVSGTDTLGAAGAASVKIRLQHDFRAEDVTFTGSASGAKVTSIFFGDRVVWSSSEGIDATVFGSTSLLRGLLRGQSLRAGLDITVNGSLTGAGDFAVTIIGQKPVSSQC
jgi:hypothetical protein